MECTPSDFEWYFDPYYGKVKIYYYFSFTEEIIKINFVISKGNCYRFNSIQTPKQDRIISRTGLSNGLYLELFVSKATDLYTLAYYSGVHLFVGNKTYFNFITDGKFSLYL